MKNLAAILAFCICCLPAAANADAARLPAEAERLVDEMAKWEKKQRDDVERMIAAKRKMVIISLKRVMDAETKRGNLDRALMVRKEVEKMEKANEEVKKNHTPVTDGHVGKTYVLPWDSGEGNVRVTFHRKGIASQLTEKTNKNWDKAFRWELTGDRELEFWYKDNTMGSLMKWSFSDDWETAKVENRKKQQVYDAKVRK